MANYTSQEKLNIVFGETNVIRWANLSNTNNINNKEIKDRIDYFCLIATSYVNGRFQLTRYTDDIPFVVDHVPHMVEFITTLLGGALLFDGRVNRVMSEDKEVNKSRREFGKLMRQILCGQLKLEDPLSGELLGTSCYLAPSVALAPSSGAGSGNGCCAGCNCPCCRWLSCFTTCHNSSCYCYSCINSRVLIYAN